MIPVKVDYIILSINDAPAVHDTRLLVPTVALYF